MGVRRPGQPGSSTVPGPLLRTGEGSLGGDSGEGAGVESGSCPGPKWPAVPPPPGPSKTRAAEQTLKGGRSADPQYLLPPTHMHVPSALGTRGFHTGKFAYWRIFMATPKPTLTVLSRSLTDTHTVARNWSRPGARSQLRANKTPVCPPNGALML